MAKTNKKNQKQQKQQPTPQPTTPAKPVELSDVDLGQVGGGFQCGPNSNPIFTLRCAPEGPTA